MLELRTSQIDEASHMLARAFQDDPAMIYLIPEAIARAEILIHYFRATVRYAHLYGQVFVTPGAVQGIAAWLTPGHTTVTFPRMLRAGMLQVMLKVGFRRMLRAVHYLNYAESLGRRCLHEPHWHLGVLGVEPTCQRQGIGAALIQPVLTRVGNLPCFLITGTEANVRFYQRHGFEVRGEGDVTTQGPHLWAMVRPG
jgi:ribosomal protein S18 acetylase RimI-like enzyme